MSLQLPKDWSRVLADQLSADYFRELQQFVATQRASHHVFPPADKVFAAFKATPYEQVRVLLLGQDPYHDHGQAHGLCFSVPSGVKPPPSLVNIFKELHADVGCPVPDHGCLEAWARQGVLLLNTVLTVRAHEPNSHRKRGWETFTDAVIRAVNDKTSPVIFLLWGRSAQQKAKLVDLERHAIVQSTHPSPLSANRGFFGSRPFSKVNRELASRGQAEIDWHLP